ncbi:MAG: glycosyltransferase family 2 protein [Candidatus Aminicenantales bacterium]
MKSVQRMHPEKKHSFGGDLSIIIVNYNGRDYLLRTLGSIFHNVKLDHEVIVVDNGSTDGSREAVRKAYPSVRLLALDHNTGFARGNNEGATKASGRYLLILNNDTYVPKGTVEKLVSILRASPDMAIVAPLVFNPDNSIQISWGKDLNLLTEIFMKHLAERWYRFIYKVKQGRMSRDVDWVSGACFLIERDLYRRVGGFDENFFMYMEDADLSKRLRQKGYRIHLCSEARIIHYLRQSSSRHSGRILREAKKGQLYYYCKHNSRLAFWMLKHYLLLRFRLKLSVFRLKKDTQGLRTCEEILQVIREFDREDHT